VKNQGKKTKTPAEPRKELTAAQRRYMLALEKLEREQKPFTHRLMADMFKWKSHVNSWLFVERLIFKGALTPGSRLAFIDCPVITPLGRELLGDTERKAA
jgi:hypothetical protein